MNSNNGNLSFTGGMDTTQIRADVAKAKTEFKGLGDSAKAEGVRVEQAFNAAAAASTASFQKSTISLKDQIAQQRQIIREITGDIKQLVIASKEASNPGKKSEILGDLSGARKALAEEQATLIGLQRQQLDANGKEVDSQGGMIAGLGKWALGLASVAGAMKIGHSIMESTEATAHVLEQGIAGAEAATSYFFKTIASGDWSNFFEGMNAAVSGAIEFVNAMEDIDNRLNEQKIKGCNIPT